MRHVISSAFVLLAIFLVAGQLQAQSGRARPSPSTSGTSSARPTTAADDAEETPETTGPAETIEGDVLRVDTSLVTVPVSVMDRYGKYIPNLRRQDFHIFDEGVEQKIAYFATVDQPFTVALVIDTSGSTHFKLEEIQDAAISFVNQLQPEDRVLVISFDDSIRVLSEATNDRTALMHAIRRSRTGGGTRLYDAVDMVIRKKLSSISGRKAVVLFTDGVDTTSRSASYSSTLREAQESDGAFYTVNYDTSQDVLGQGGIPTPGSTGIGIWIPGWPGGKGGKGGGLPGGIGNGPATGDYRRATEYLHELAETSGGRYYRGDTMMGISAAFAEVADELRRQYSLGYYPRQAGQAGQLRKIKVRVNKPDLVVKSRDSYIYSQKKTNDKDPVTQQLTDGN
ncbi:MAG: von Willebrand factor type domain protein [Acidobacteria bacterium]|nr:von Willebrand factor type domain protein [Acidobacteriota bacterium]